MSGLQRAAWGLAMSLALAACATDAHNEAVRTHTVLQENVAASRACRATISAKPQYARLLTKFALRSPTAAQLNDPEPVADADIASGLDWYAEWQRCDASELDAFGRADPDLLASMAPVMQEQAELFAKFTSERMTYGEVNRRIATLQGHSLAAAKAWGERFKARIAAQHQQELASRQQAAEVATAVLQGFAAAALGATAALAQQQTALAQAQMRFAASHPVYVPAYRITTINCQRIGSSFVTCSQF